ncbi:MAG: hypothetical protein HC897_11420 [Thermoanaerobaculia bacterium]|nr:hypothetical protein [Thermoanaerobaculia bacterium]
MLGVAVFLVWVVLPLFTPASVEDFSTRGQASGGELLHVAVDEYGLIGWALKRDGAVEVFRLDDGSQRHGERIAEPGQLESASFLLQSDLSVLGFADGSMRFAEIGFETRILDRADLPAEAADRVDELPTDTAVDYLDGIVERTPSDQYRVQRLSVELGDSVQLSDGPVHRITHVPGPEGPIVAALAEDSTGAGLYVIVGREKSDFLTGRSTLTFDDPVRIPFDALGGFPSHVAIAGTGKDVFLAWEGGEIERIDVTDLSAPYVAERGRLVPRGTALTALSFILGNNTLVWGDSQGEVEAGFLVRLEDLEDPSALGLYEANAIRAPPRF